MRTRSTLASLAAVLAVGALALTGCATSSAPPSDTPTTAALSGELKIDAASSLKAAFEAIAKAFTVANPGVTIDPINYDGSSTLVTQITEGADVDIFASADQANMQKVVTAGLITGDTPLFATNTLVIAVPKGNPGGIKGLSDLENPALKIVICADAVPCGSAAQKLFKAASVTITPASEEQNVTAVLTKVDSGDADAGIVYATDAEGDASHVDAIVPPEAAGVINQYPIAALDASKNAAVAKAFVAFVTGPQGQAILKGLGFGQP